LHLQLSTPGPRPGIPDEDGTVRDDLRPGGSFPDLELTDHAGNVRSLEALVGGDPTFVHFYRGWWCPKEQQFLRQLVRFQDEVEVAYTRLVSISIDPPTVASAFRAGLGARWTFLCDPERRYVDELDLRETTDTKHDPYVPAGFLLGPGLDVHATWNGYWFWGRPTMEELRQGFRTVSREVRPDWEVPRA
jgi:peroxiredoxin